MDVPVLPAPVLGPAAARVWGSGPVQGARSPSSLPSPPTLSLPLQEAVRLWYALCSAHWLKAPTPQLGQEAKVREPPAVFITPDSW